MFGIYLLSYLMVKTACSLLRFISELNFKKVVNLVSYCSLLLNLKSMNCVFSRLKDIGVTIIFPFEILLR